MKGKIHNVETGETIALAGKHRYTVPKGTYRILETIEVEPGELLQGEKGQHRTGGELRRVKSELRPVEQKAPPKPL